MIAELYGYAGRPEKTGHHYLCPECGSRMLETARSAENGGVYIWYECTRESCSGQWLEKQPLFEKALH